MSALGSSFINKSGKKFAPKAAPGRRQALSTSTQTSSRPSVDRQIHSQTPQPQLPPQRVVASPVPSSSLSTPALTQQAAAVVVSQRDVVAPNAIPSADASLLKSRSDNGILLRKKPPSSQQISKTPPPNGQLFQDGRISVSAAGASTITLQGASLPTTGPVSSPPPIVRLDTPTVVAASAPTTESSPFGEKDVQGSQTPPPKRRRIATPSDQSAITLPAMINTDANIPLPTTETSDLINESPRRALTPTESGHTIFADESTETAQAKRKRRIDGAAEIIVAGATNGPPAKSVKPRKTAKGKDAKKRISAVSEIPAGVIEGSAIHTESSIAPNKPKRKYTRKRDQQSIQDAAADIVEDAVQGSSKQRAKTGRRRKRAATPEDAASITIKPSEIKMADLCRDGRTGRVSKREMDLREYEKAELVRKKQKELQELMGQTQSETAETGATVESTDERVERLRRRNTREESVALNVPTTIVVNGEIRIDEDSLQIDRHAAAAIERAAEQLDSIEESDLTRKMNQGTYLKRDKSGGWNELLTEKFYDGLRMFGTDFEMISKMFPGRTRHKIKLKFVKEEKINHDKIKATLLGEKLAVDLAELEKLAGEEFDDPAELEREMAEDQKRLEEETVEERRLMEQSQKERDDVIANERAAAGETTAGEESSTKENRGRKSKKKGAKRKKGEPKKMGKQAMRAAANIGVEIPADAD